MFINNKYTNWYINLISAFQLTPPSSDTYTENHHIIPRCMGGVDSPENLVRLTAKAHFIAHRLLTKMTEGLFHRKMCFALWMMTKDPKQRSSRYNVTAVVYQSIKQQMAEQMREQTRENNLKSNAGKRLGEYTSIHGPANKGKTMSAKFKRKVSAARRGTKSSDETKAKISAGIQKWNEQRLGTSSSLKGRSIPKYTTIIRNKFTQELYTTTHQTQWLKDRGLARHVLERGTCDYEVVRRFLTKTGEDIPLRRQ